MDSETRRISERSGRESTRSSLFRPGGWRARPPLLPPRRHGRFGNPRRRRRFAPYRTGKRRRRRHGNSPSAVGAAAGAAGTQKRGSSATQIAAPDDCSGAGDAAGVHDATGEIERRTRGVKDLRSGGRAVSPDQHAGRNRSRRLRHTGRPPSAARFPAKVHPSKTGSDRESQWNPPPPPEAAFPVKAQFRKTGEAFTQRTPAPIAAEPFRKNDPLDPLSRRPPPHREARGRFPRRRSAPSPRRALPRRASRPTSSPDRAHGRRPTRPERLSPYSAAARPSAIVAASPGTRIACDV